MMISLGGLSSTPLTPDSVIPGAIGRLVRKQTKRVSGPTAESAGAEVRLPNQQNRCEGIVSKRLAGHPTYGLFACHDG